MYGVFYWVKGAPSHRVGGPWWFKWFTSSTDAERFCEDMKGLVSSMTAPIPLNVHEVNRAQTSGFVHPPTGICSGCSECGKVSF